MFSPAQRFNTRIAPKISIFLTLHHSLRMSKLDLKIYLMTRYLSLSFCDRKETLLGNSGSKCALLYLISADIHVFGHVKVKSASSLWTRSSFRQVLKVVLLYFNTIKNECKAMLTLFAFKTITFETHSAFASSLNTYGVNITLLTVIHY